MNLEHDTQINMNVVKICIDKFGVIHVSSSINFTVIRFQRFLPVRRGYNSLIDLCDIEVSYSSITDLYDMAIYNEEGQMIFKAADKQVIDMIGLIWDLAYNYKHFV